MTINGPASVDVTLGNGTTIMFGLTWNPKTGATMTHYSYGRGQEPSAEDLAEAWEVLARFAPSNLPGDVQAACMVITGTKVRNTAELVNAIQSALREAGRL